LADERVRDELAKWLPVIIALIALVIQIRESGENQNVTPEQVIKNQTVYEVNVEASDTGEQPRVVNPVGRNEPCPCGSGKKYKKCHGDPAREQRTSPTR
jgi:uncharacterized protein YecA (UPF0149 family)